MLDTLSQQCDKNTQQSHLAQHTRLNNLTFVILDKASLHGQRLERLVRQWQELSEKYDQLRGFLEDIEQQMPRPVASDDSIMAIQEKINTYQRLQRELTDEKPTVFQVVDKGKQLLHSLNCPGLESEVTELAEKWVNLNTVLSLELKR
jgi:DNA repair ATPase RecN